MAERMSIADKVVSIRQSVGMDYTRPDPNRLEVMMKDLWENTKALKYLIEQRGLARETIKHFKLGYDTSTNAIAIPIYKNGVLCNIKYRLLDNPDQRYSGEKNAEPWLFNERGLVFAAEKNSILIVEGEIDAMSAWQAGVKNVISPSSGKDSFGIWLEKVDVFERIYLAFDNDEGGRTSSKKMAERLGNERCFDINYPDSKDANEYLSKHTPAEFRGLLVKSKPFTRHQFKSVGDVISGLASGDRSYTESSFIPKVRFKGGWMGVISGRQNVGKTSYVMNIANEFASQGLGVLVMPFERGIESVGQRFLQVRYKATEQDFDVYQPEDWEALKQDAAELPLYFAMPSKEETVDFIVRSKRYFDIKVVIVDHLDYLVRQLGNTSKGDAIADTLQQMKRVAEDAGIILLIVSHIRKIEQAGGFISRSKAPNIEDLKGSSSLYQDPEVVVMLSQTINDNEVLVDVQKNKGIMSSAFFDVNTYTGVFGSPKHATSTSERQKIIEEDKIKSKELYGDF